MENRSAFDVAFELELPDGTAGIIGIETKYHEHSKREQRPSDDRLRRYESVTLRSGVFNRGALEALIGTRLQQVWLDHLLALSMLQDASKQWKWAKFVLIHPKENASYARAAAEYRQLLTHVPTFEVRELESVLDDAALPPAAVSAFRRRYLW